jgi:ketosteroid isomerase-like protein
MSRSWVLGGIAGALVASLARGAEPPPEGGVPGSDVAQIEALTRTFVDGFNSRDVDRVLSFYADRYVDVNLRRPVQTRAERREYFLKILERRDATVDVTPDEIIVHGEYAFVRGTILLHRTPKGAEPRETELRYMEVVRRFPEGWKAIWGMDAEIYPDPE